MTAEVQCWCQHCKKELPPSHTGPCPHCGKTGKDCKVTASVAIGLAVSHSAQKVHKYTKKHPLLTAISIALTIISPIVGYLLDDALVGLLIGIILAILNLWLTPHVKETIVEITHLGDKGKGAQEAKTKNDTQKPDYSHKGIYRRLRDIENKIDSSRRIQNFAFIYALGAAFVILGLSRWSDFLELIGLDTAGGSINPIAFIILGSITMILAYIVSRRRSRN